MAIDYSNLHSDNVAGEMVMQLNIYVPKDKEGLLAKLDTVAGQLGKAKNEIVLEALEQYLRLNAATAVLGRYRSRVIGSLSLEGTSTGIGYNDDRD